MIGLILTIAIFGLVMLAMSLGVLLNDRCLRGSCGGPDVLGPDGESLLCATCPRRGERRPAAEEELAVLSREPGNAAT